MPPPDFGSNLLELFGRTASRRGSAPCLWAKREGTYRPWSWQRVANEVRALARALRARGVAPGDRVLLVAENRPEWAIADLAIMAAGGVTVPAYTTNTTENNAYLLNHSGAAAAFVSTDRLAARLLPAVARAPALKLVVSMEPLAEVEQLSVPVLAWAEALALGEQSAAPSLDPATALTRDDLACFIYTSGTGGNPKGVMLTHGNILANVAGAHAVLETLVLGDDEVFLSFLPLSHAYEHTAGQFLPLAVGAQIYYADGLEALASNFVEVRPTIVACVPRLYEVMRQRILRMTARQTWPKGEAVRQDGRPGQQGLRTSRGDGLGRKDARSAARQAGARCRAGALRRPDQGAGVRRRAVELRRRAVLHGARRAAVSGLWPDRMLAGDQRQRSGPDEAAHRRAADPGDGGQDRRRRRDPGARPVGHAGLLARRERRPPRCYAMAGCTPATSA